MLTKKVLNCDGIIIAGLVLINLVCFSRNIDGHFVFDDNEAIVNNKDVTKPVQNIWKLFQHDFWGSNISSNTSHKSYRPLTVLTFRWNYVYAGGLHPTSFHVVNVALHTFVSVLLYFVLKDVFSGLGLPQKGAIMSCYLFTAHPIHTEAVAGVVGRAELLFALLLLSAFYCYVTACRQETKPVRHLMFLVIACTLTVVSVLCKEQGLSVLGLCSAYDVIIYNQQHPVIFWFHLPGLIKSRAGSKCLVRHLGLLLTGLLVLTVRFRIMGSQVPVFQEVDNPHSFLPSLLMRIINYNYLYSLNAWLCLCPYWLCFDWSMGCVPVMTSLLDMRIAAVVIFWAVIMLLLYWCLSTPFTPYKRLVQFSVAVAVVPFLPASNLLFRVGFVIAERVLYLPSLGPCLIFTTTILMLGDRYKDGRAKQMFDAGFVFLLIVFISRSSQRTLDWRNEMDLFQSAEAVCPLNAKVHYNIAKVHADIGNEDYAIAKYRLAIQLNPTYDQAMNNLANLLKERGEIEDAETLLNKAVTIRADFAAAWMNLGIVQASLRKTDLAEASYKTALRHRKRYPDCYYNLGNLYLDLGGREAEALAAWRQATLQKPTHISAWVNMIILLDNLGRYDDLLVVANEAIEHNPTEAQLFYNVGSALGKAGRYAESEEYFLKAVQLQPYSAQYHANLGVLYHRWGKFSKADQSYTRAIEINPKDSQILSYRDNVRNKLKQLPNENG